MLQSDVHSAAHARVPNIRSGQLSTQESRPVGLTWYFTISLSNCFLDIKLK